MRGRSEHKRGKAANLGCSELLVATQTAQHKRYGKEGLQGGPLVKRSWSPGSGSLGVAKGMGQEAVGGLSDREVGRE